MNTFGGLFRDWVAGKHMFMRLLGHIISVRKTHEQATKSPEDPGTIPWTFYVFFVFTGLSCSIKNPFCANAQGTFLTAFATSRANWGAPMSRTQQAPTQSTMLLLSNFHSLEKLLRYFYEPGRRAIAKKTCAFLSRTFRLLCRPVCPLNFFVADSPTASRSMTWRVLDKRCAEKGWVAAPLTSCRWEMGPKLRMAQKWAQGGGEGATECSGLLDLCPSFYCENWPNKFEKAHHLVYFGGVRVGVPSLDRHTMLLVHSLERCRGDKKKSCSNLHSCPTDEAQKLPLIL